MSALRKYTQVLIYDIQGLFSSDGYGTANIFNAMGSESSSLLTYEWKTIRK